MVKKTAAFVLLQAALLVTTASAQQQHQAHPQEDSEQQPMPVQCTPELVEEFDFTNDGQIGKIEFIHLLEELAPSSCNVVSLWQSRDSFQIALQELSCLCTEFGGTTDDDDANNCCSSGSSSLSSGSATSSAFAVRGRYHEAYDHAVCEKIEQVIRVECFEAALLEEEEEEESQSSSPTKVVSKPSLRHYHPSSNPTPITISETKISSTTTDIIAPPTTSTIDVALAIAVIGMSLVLCILLLLRTLSSSSSSTTTTTFDTKAVAQQLTHHQEKPIKEKQMHDASMEITSTTTPYVQMV